MALDNNAGDVETSIDLVVRATNFAAVAHRNEIRKDGRTPYINHPIGVMAILVQLGSIHDPIVLASAVLHDTVEDTDTTLQDIQTQFGPRIRSIVAEVSDDKSLPSEERKRLQIVHAPALSREAKLVKLADMLYNLRDINRILPNGWSRERAEQYFTWKYKVMVGLRGTNANIEMELDRLFKQKGLVA